MALGQALDAAGGVELAPFGAQARDGVALAAQLAGELGHALGLQGGIELDLVDEGRRQDQRADDEDVQEAHGSAPLQHGGERRQARQQIGGVRRLACRRVAAFGGAQLGRAGARIARDLVIVGNDRPPGQRVERRRGAFGLRRVARAGARLAATG